MRTSTVVRRPLAWLLAPLALLALACQSNVPYSEIERIQVTLDSQPPAAELYLVSQLAWKDVNLSTGSPSPALLAKLRPWVRRDNLQLTERTAPLTNVDIPTLPMVLVGFDGDRWGYHAFQAKTSGATITVELDGVR